MVFDGGNSNYCLGENARNNILITANNWTITDAGRDCSLYTPVVTLLGDNTVNLEAGDNWVDSGATWTDMVDGSGIVLPASSGSVNVYVP